MKKHRESILKAAGAVFSRKGFHGASVEEIARKAGVGKGTIYLYFEDKTRLFAATVTEGMEQMIGQLRSQLNSDLPFMEHLRQMIENNVDVYRNFGDLMKIVATELTRGIDKNVLAEIEAVRDRYVDFIAETLENGHRLGYVRAVDFRLVAQAIVGSLDGFFRFPMSMNRKRIATGSWTPSISWCPAASLFHDRDLSSPPPTPGRYNSVETSPRFRMAGSRRK